MFIISFYIFFKRKEYRELLIALSKQSFYQHVDLSSSFNSLANKNFARLYNFQTSIKLCVFYFLKNNLIKNQFTSSFNSLANKNFARLYNFQTSIKLCVFLFS
jgi:hypothetical protein